MTFEEYWAKTQTGVPLGDDIKDLCREFWNNSEAFALMRACLTIKTLRKQSIATGQPAIDNAVRLAYGKAMVAVAELPASGPLGLPEGEEGVEKLADEIE